jgi:hypothetical protein
MSLLLFTLSFSNAHFNLLLLPIRLIGIAGTHLFVCIQSDYIMTHSIKIQEYKLVVGHEGVFELLVDILGEANCFLSNQMVRFFVDK